MQISLMFFIVRQRQANFKENFLVTEKGILLESLYSFFYKRNYKTNDDNLTPGQ